MSDNEKTQDASLEGGRWPEPRLKALQVEQLYGFAPTATAFSYFGALLTLGVLIEIGDIGRGAVWFLWATAVTFFRSTCIVAYRRRPVDSDPDAWGRLMIAANFLAGVQWGVLGTLLFPEGTAYLQLFTLMVIICFVAGSVTACRFRNFPALRQPGDDLEILVAGDQPFKHLAEMRVGSALVQRIGIERFEVALVGVTQRLGRCRRHRESKDRSRDGCLGRCKQTLTYRHLFDFPTLISYFRKVRSGYCRSMLPKSSRRASVNCRGETAVCAAMRQWLASP